MLNHLYFFIHRNFSLISKLIKHIIFQKVKNIYITYRNTFKRKTTFKMGTLDSKLIEVFDIVHIGL